MVKRISLTLSLASALFLGLAVLGQPSVSAQALLAGKNKIQTVSSTVPADGDVNPYGVARVPVTIGNLVHNDILVSNFNNSANLQGTGTTIVQISPAGAQTLFAQIDASTLPGPCPGGMGLTTALVVLRTGWVIVGSLPTTDGTAATAQAGCLIVLDNQGHVAETISGPDINGPWDATAFDGGELVALFVTNVLNGTVAAGGAVVNQGTVVRLVLSVSTEDKPKVLVSTVIGSGFPERTDPAAMVIGPTGLALDRDHDVLYVADSLNNRIAAISGPLSRKTSAGTGRTVSQGGALNDPLGLARTPNGDVIAANGDDGNLVEVTPGGRQAAVQQVDSSGSPPGAGALFGLAVVGNKLYFVDDATNTLNLLK